jgi:hypothetical protein
MLDRSCILIPRRNQGGCGGNSAELYELPETWKPRPGPGPDRPSRQAVAAAWPMRPIGPRPGRNDIAQKCVDRSKPTQFRVPLPIIRKNACLQMLRRTACRWRLPDAQTAGGIVCRRARPEKPKGEVCRTRRGRGRGGAPEKAKHEDQMPRNRKYSYLHGSR